MRAIFIELPPFQRLRDEYFDDAAFKDFQHTLMKNPEAGNVIKGTGDCGKSDMAMSGAVKENVVASGSSTTGKACRIISGCSLSMTKTKPMTLALTNAEC